MSHKINYRRETTPVESIELTLDMQEFAALATLTHHAIAGGHPLVKTVTSALSDLPKDVRREVEKIRVSTPLVATGYPLATFAKELK